jgi:hypothetical protein
MWITNQNNLHPPALMNIPFRSIIAVCALLLSCCAGAKAEDAGQTVWMVSTRNAPHCGDLQDAADKLNFRHKVDCSWIESSEDEFQKSAAGLTVVFISGNRSDAEDTLAKGCFLHSILRCAAESRAFRYVIWDWPADRYCRGNRSDAQLKVSYSKAESYYLASWLARFPRGEKVCLVGHSLGARIIANAMHLLADGEVAGRTMPRQTVEQWKGGARNRVNAVLLAAAVDADCFAKGCQCEAFSLFEKLLVTKNGCDRALKWYPRLWGRGGPQAMGFVGPRRIDSKKVAVIDVCGMLGKSHDSMEYCSAVDACGLWARYAFFEDTPVQKAP